MRVPFRSTVFMLVIFGLALAAMPLRAHEGHDHGAPEPMTSDPNLVVRSASNEDYEVVLKYRSQPGQKSTNVRVYLSEFSTNAPIERAQIALRTTTPRRMEVAASALSPGTYEAALPYEQSGKYTLILAVTSPPAAEFAFQNLPMGEDAIAGAPNRSQAAGRWPWGWLVAGLALALLGITFLVLRRRSLRPISRAALPLVVAASTAGLWWHRSPAHEGHDEPPVATSTPASGSEPRYMPKESQFFLGVRTLPARSERLRARISAVGHVTPESGALARIEAPRDGKIEAVGRRLAVGDRVRHGQVIAHLLVIDRLPIRAPISGLVAEVRFTAGQWVQAGAPLVVILDERQVRVELPLFGENLNRALRTRDATITTSALPGAEFRGRVRGLAPTAPEESENQPAAGSPIPPILVSVENRGGLLRPGMLVEASLELPEAEELIAVPESALLQQESGSFVFVHTGAEVFEQRAVRIAGRYGTRVGVSGNVKTGDRIVIEGAQMLVSAPPVATNLPAGAEGNAR